MYSALSVTTPPATEPVSVAIAKQHTRIDNTADDNLVAMYITAARTWVESYLGRVLMTQTLQWVMLQEPPRGAWPMVQAPWLILPLALSWPQVYQTPLELPRSPVQEILSVGIGQPGQADTVLDPSTYTVDTAIEPPRLCLQPFAQNNCWTHIAVSFVGGYADPTTIPQPILHAIMLLTAWLYEERGDVGGDMPPAVQMLLAPYRISYFGG